MNIIFYGQLGLPQLNQGGSNGQASRVEALARQLVRDGHTVTVLGTAPYLAQGNFHGIELKYLPSLNPQKPGGLLYLLLGLIYVVFRQPATIHVHGSRAALLLTLTRFLFRDTRIVWTIDKLPLLRLLTTHYSLLTLENITTPSRALQYRLLVEHGIRAAYIPDGYEEPSVSDIATTHVSLKKGQYSVVLVESAAALRRVAVAYAKSKTEKKLVVFAREEVAYPAFRRDPARGGGKLLKKQFPFLVLITHYTLLITPRLRRSILNSAAAVIIGDESVSTTLLLEAMHGSRAIIAPTLAAYQEILGTAGQYVAAGDTAGLTAAINKVVTSPAAQAAWGAKAHTRATHHFTWPRLMEDYQTLYVPHVRLIPLDSVGLVRDSVSKGI
jgi:hypothetical protein